MCGQWAEVFKRSLECVEKIFEQSLGSCTLQKPYSSFASVGDCVTKLYGYFERTCILLAGSNCDLAHGRAWDFEVT